MNKFLRVIFILLILAMLGAAMIQIFQPQLLGNESIYGLAPYWQREIGFWNLAILPLAIAANIKYDWFYLRMTLLALIVGGLGFGTNPVSYTHLNSHDWRRGKRYSSPARSRLLDCYG